MKKIGIVSRIHGVNYGASLQAVALQTVLSQHGAIVEYINRKVEIQLSAIHKIKSNVYGIVRLLLGFKKRLHNTLSFQDKYLNKSKIVNSQKEIESLVRTYDILLSGSDQIWNPRYLTLSDNFYLLPYYIEKAHFSYASSFGVDTIPNELKNIYYKHLSVFKTISVRETTGQRILSEIGVSSRVDIDPTLLLREDEWLQFFKKEPIISGKYICCYVMNGASNLNNYIIKQAEIMQRLLGSATKIVILGEKEYKGWFSKHTYIPTAGPSEFLNILYNSCFVLTSSFHGTCFSVIFKKNFYSILAKKNILNSRIVDLLSQLKLDDRIIYDNGCRQVKNDVINYHASDIILENMRTASLLYVKEIIDYQI